MSGRVERWLDASLCCSPAQPIFLWRAAHHLTVLAYHGIDDPYRFEEQLDYLVRRMHPVTLDEVLEALAGRRGLPKRAVLITFDDGERSLVDLAMPLLRDRGLPGVAFVIAGLLDTNQPFWWVEVKMLAQHGGFVSSFPQLTSVELARVLKRVADEQRLAALTELRQTAALAAPVMPQLYRHELGLLEAAGITIGNHTLTHPCLPYCSEDKLLLELSQAHEILTTALGYAPRVFAYPNGDADERVVKILQRLGYEAAFLFDHQLSLKPPPDRFRISRLRVNSDTPLDRFRLIVSGLHPTLHHALGRN